jgi:transcriptional regulator with XRE-family HTH domain
MYQPDLGLKVAELRQLKGFTQEELAERCEVSARTVQRIESGEVDPRAFTLRCLGRELEFDFEGWAVGNESIWLVVLHLSSILCLVIVPLLIWSWKKNQSQAIESQARKPRILVPGAVYHVYNRVTRWMPLISGIHLC